jgi:hypothetical protein
VVEERPAGRPDHPGGRDLPPPAPPPQGQAQTVTATALNSGRVAVSWTYNGPEVVGQDIQFIVSRAPDNNGTPGTPVQIGFVPRLNFIDSNTSLSTKYYYYVTPVTFGGPGTQAGPASVTTIAGPVGTGAQETYFDQPDLNPGGTPSKTPSLGPVWPTTIVTPTINYFWGPAAPAGATGNFGPGGAPFGADQFVVAWTMQIKPEFTGTYSFFTETDDGYRLVVNGQLLQDRMDARQGMTISQPATIDLVAGQPVSVVMQMCEDGGDAGARLYWSQANIPMEIIPQAVMTPEPADTEAPKLTNLLVDGHIPSTATYTPALHLSMVFSENVAGVDDGDFEVVSTTLGVLDGQVFDVAYDPASHNAIMTFSFPLPDGNYTLNIKNGAFGDAFGNPLDGDNDGIGGGAAAIPFYVFAGDTQMAFDGTPKRDRTIDFVDYQIMARNFGMTNPSASDGDVNYDGQVDNADFEFIRSHFGQTLPGPAAPVATTPAPSPVPVTPTPTKPRPAPRPVPKSVAVSNPAPTPKTAVSVVSAAVKPVAKLAPKTFATRKIGSKDLLA